MCRAHFHVVGLQNGTAVIGPVIAEAGSAPENERLMHMGMASRRLRNGSAENGKDGAFSALAPERQERALANSGNAEHFVALQFAYDRFQPFWFRSRLRA